MNRFGGNRDSLKQIAPSELHQVKLKRQAAYGDVLMAFLSDAGSTPATSTLSADEREEMQPRIHAKEAVG